MGVFTLKVPEKSWMRELNPAEKDLEKKLVKEESEVNIYLKVLIFIINFISFTCIGLFLIAYAIHSLASTSNLYSIEKIWKLNVIICIVGITVSAVSFVGFMGSIRENLRILYAYKYMEILLLLGQTILSIVVLVYIFVPSSRKNIEFFPKKSFWEAMKNYPLSVPSDDFTVNSVDMLQELFHCCGLSDSDEGYRDWQQVHQFNCDLSKSSNVFACTVPTSCCNLSKGANATCVDDVLRQRPIDVQDKIYMQGCLKAFHTFTVKNGLSIVAVCLGIIIPQIVLLSMTLIFMNQIIRQIAKWEN